VGIEKNILRILLPERILFATLKKFSGFLDSFILLKLGLREFRVVLELWGFKIGRRVFPSCQCRLRAAA